MASVERGGRLTRLKETARGLRDNLKALEVRLGPAAVRAEFDNDKEPEQ